MGDFENGLRHGEGKIQSSDPQREQYEGDFEYGLYHGYGYLQKGDKVLEGTFIKGKYIQKNSP